MECFGKTESGLMKNKVVAFIESLPGKLKPKMSAEVSQCITSAAKIHAGQLVELSKMI